MNPLHLQPERTAFVAIDLQQGIVGMPGVPHPTSTVVRHAARLADALRRAGAFIVFVHVDFVDGKDALQPVTEKQLPAKPMDNWAGWSPICMSSPEIILSSSGASGRFSAQIWICSFADAASTILLCGISTHIGVDTTAREAYQLNYNQIFVTDAMTAPFKEAHEFPCEHVFPLMGRLHTTADVLAALD